jgi:hypothetical protein
MSRIVPPNKPFIALDGTVLTLSGSRYDERQRSQHVRLAKTIWCWDYAPLFDVVRLEPGFETFRFTGKSALEWVKDLERSNPEEAERFAEWYVALVEPYVSALSKRSRIPRNFYSTELAHPPLASSLPKLIRALKMRHANAEHWEAALRSLAGKGLKSEELNESGVLIRLKTRFPGKILSQAQVFSLIEFDHVTPRLVCESRFGFETKAGWDECCECVPQKEFVKRGLWGGKGDGSWYVIRHRHRALGWSIVRCRYLDLFVRHLDWWWILDEHGKKIARQPEDGFSSPERAIHYAEFEIKSRFKSMGRDLALTKWEQYSLPGGDGYREILIQLHDWPDTYQARHFETRNVLIHIRSGIRETNDGRRVLFLDEIQSDWHADIHWKRNKNAEEPPPDAPFRKDWPLLALKLMLWWSQRQGLDGLAWSTAELQAARWREYKPPEMLYRSALPDAARSMARVLNLDFTQTRMSVRDNTRCVELSNDGRWVVLNQSGVQITKPFWSQGQAETFANLTGTFVTLDVPVLWLNDLPRIKAIPLYGVADKEFWFQRV